MVSLYGKRNRRRSFSMKFHEACLMFRSGVTLFGVLVGFLPWTRTTHKDKSHHDHAAAHVSGNAWNNYRLQCANLMPRTTQRNQRIRTYQTCWILKMPRNLTLVRSKLWPFGDRDFLECVELGSCQLEFFLPWYIWWMRSGWGPKMNSYTVLVFEKEECGVSLCTNIPQIWQWGMTNAFQGVVHEPPVSSICNPHRWVEFPRCSLSVWLCLSASSLLEVILHHFPPHTVLKSILCGLQVPFHAALFIAGTATTNRPAGPYLIS